MHRYPLLCAWGDAVVNKALCVAHPLSLLVRRTSALPSSMILKSLSAFACEDTLWNDVLAGSFRTVTQCFMEKPPADLVVRMN